MPKHFFTHAASLHQGFPHCAISPTAASRRSLGRVSVPMWPSALSGRLPIVALVVRCTANKLIGRGPIPYRLSAFHTAPCGAVRLRGISRGFPLLSPGMGQVAHALLTRPPLACKSIGRILLHYTPVRLACVRHAASVHPEPGSNSQKNIFRRPRTSFESSAPDVGIFRCRCRSFAFASVSVSVSSQFWSLPSLCLFYKTEKSL